jgi:FkbM family methyltransferase
MDMKHAIKEYLKMFPVLYNIVRKGYRLLFPARSSEEIIQKEIRRILGKKPSIFFVQVGSNDGVQGDPLHNLIAKNERWMGIFIEPVEFLFERLKKNYQHADRFIFENKAVGTEKGKMKFYYVSEKAKANLGDSLPCWYDQLGSFDKDHILKCLGGRIEPFIIEQDIESVRIQEIFDRNGVKKIDLLHIDTEGFDYKVLSQINFSKYRPLVVLYEHMHLSADEKEKARSMLRVFGYACVEYGGDTLAIMKG